MGMERYYSVQEAAIRLGVSTSTVRRWINDGRLRARIILNPGRRSTFKVGARALEAFHRSYVRDSVDDDWS